MAFFFFGGNKHRDDGALQTAFLEVLFNSSVIQNSEIHIKVGSFSGRLWISGFQPLKAIALLLFSFKANIVRFFELAKNTSAINLCRLNQCSL